INDYKIRIDQNEKLHQENLKRIEDSKDKLKQFYPKYDAYIERLNKSINDLKAGEDLKLIIQQHTENKKIFSNTFNQLFNPIHTNIVSLPSLRMETESPNHSAQVGNRQHSSQNSGHYKEHKQ